MTDTLTNMTEEEVNGRFAAGDVDGDSLAQLRADVSYQVQCVQRHVQELQDHVRKLEDRYNG